MSLTKKFEHIQIFGIVIKVEAKNFDKSHLFQKVVCLQSLRNRETRANIVKLYRKARRAGKRVDNKIRKDVDCMFDWFCFSKLTVSINECKIICFGM